MKSLLLILLLQQIHRSTSESVVEPINQCGFNDSDLNLGQPTPGQARSPHDTGVWYRWTDGKIPYYFKGHVTDGDKALFRDIMDEIEAHTCFKFIQEDSEPSGHHIEIVVDSPSCITGFDAYVSPQNPWPYKKVLLRSTRQLTDDKRCNPRGGVMHELMHALGVMHTQKRADRDNYITILKDNINRTALSQYSVFKGGRLYNQVPYDCQSIMHYGMGTYSLGLGKPTMQARNPKTCKLSWGGPVFDVGKPAPSDWKLLKIISDQVCGMKARSWSSWGAWSTCSATCGDATKTRSRTCVGYGCLGESKQTVYCDHLSKCETSCKDNITGCYRIVKYCTNPEYKKYMEETCPKTCKFCSVCEHTDISSASTCSQYKKLGFCKNDWADWMARKCAKTCKC